MATGHPRKCLYALISFLITSLTFSGCANYNPRPLSEVSPTFMERAQTQETDNIRVTVVALDDKESKKILGTSLAKRGVQPVWLSIENKGDIPHVLLQRSIDPNYYSSEEAATLCHYKRVKRFFEEGLLAVVFFPALVLIPIDLFRTRSANQKMDEAFTAYALCRPIVMPNTTSSGFVYTTLDEGTKHVHIDLYGGKEHKSFAFTLQVPGIKPDYTTKDFEERYADEKLVSYTETELHNIVHDIQPFVTDKNGKHTGDPINLVVIGTLEDVISVFAAARWDQTESLSFKSGAKMAKAFLFRSHYRYSPVSPLYYDGRSQDIALQKIRGNINARLHMRLWYTPIRFETKPVWVGTISRDIGVRFTLKTWYLTTHKIDSNIDDARDYVLEDLAQLQKISRYGYIRLGPPITSSNPKRNLTGDPFYTDNTRAVIEISDERVDLDTFSWNYSFEDKGAA